MTFSGLRGAVSLCVALFVEHMALPQVVKDVIIFHVCMVVFCTVVINGMTASWVYKQLKLGRQGSLSSKIDFQTIQTINEQMARFIKGPVSPNSKMVALSEHWFHGAMACLMSSWRYSCLHVLPRH
jgi:NhaP-type Na+/H+ and K+/H+ antiporter